MQTFTAILTRYEDKSRALIGDEQDDTQRWYEADHKIFETHLMPVLHDTIKRRVYFRLSGDTQAQCADCQGAWYKKSESEPYRMTVCENPDCVASHRRFIDWWGTRVFTDVVDLQITDLRTPPPR